MKDEVREQDLKERLALIERMLAKGRRQTERWGWTFVLFVFGTYGMIAQTLNLRSVPIHA